MLVNFQGHAQLTHVNQSQQYLTNHVFFYFHTQNYPRQCFSSLQFQTCYSDLTGYAISHYCNKKELTTVLFVLSPFAFHTTFI
ncbi:hypothetical protein Hdeb2414_s0751g00943121 [Helianthus debilis subsp. tardiflorus]